MNMHKQFLPSPVPVLILVIITFGLILGCSKDETEPLPGFPEVQVTAFGNTGSEEIQLEVGSDGGDPTIISLSDELGLQDLPFFRRAITNASVAYYFWQDQRSAAYYKDLDSGEIFSSDDICNFSSEDDVSKSILRVSGNDRFVVMAYAEYPEGAAPRFSLRILEKATGACRDLVVPEVNTSGIENYSLEGGLMALYYLEEGTGSPLITLIDLESGTIGETLILDPDFQAATFRGAELWVFNKDDTYVVYNVRTGNFTLSGTAPGLPAQGPGLFPSRFDGNRLLVNNIYQQPSLFFAQPALYDFDLGGLSEGADPFLPELQERVQLETGDRVLFGKFAVDLPTGTLALVYVRGNGAAEGGVVLTNFSREWLRVIPLPYVPEELEIRQVR